MTIAPRAPKTPAQPTPRGTVVLTSGASGGHIFPALAVAAELHKLGLRCHFVLGGGKFNGLIDAAGFAATRLPASALTDRGPVALLLGLFKLGLGVLVALRLLRRLRPVAVFGTGGYASVATMLAAKVLGIPTLIHEQNVLPGRANRFLARFATVVMTTFEETRAYFKRPVVCVGTPLRAEILAMAGAKRVADGLFRVLVLGGSQGSGVLTDVVVEAVALCQPALRKKLAVVHQARAADVPRVQAAYAKLKLPEVVVQPFFDDLPARYVAADVVVGRSGTGTLLEAATVGRAAVYSPHQLADNHQLYNARVAEKAGAAVVFSAPEFTPLALAGQLEQLAGNPALLKKMASAARSLARLHAATEVARVLLRTVENGRD